MGYYGVSTGGSKVSKRQVEMLTRLGVKICFCFDKDQQRGDIENIANMFLDNIPIYAMLDEHNILDAKESPSDSGKKWAYMLKNNIYKIKE
jgi:DNA primase